jgi:RNA polymerase sigma-70 factor (ECF subfamily)
MRRVRPDEAEAAQDTLLIQRLRAREETALDTLIGRYQARVFSLALRVTGNRQDAEEILQDVFWSVLRHIDAFRGDAKLSSWIYRIAMNAALMKIRQRPKAEHIALDADLGPAMTDDGRIAEPVMDWTRLPGELERKELTRRLEEAVERLPPDYRTGLALRDIEGLSTEEACEVLDLSVAALKSRLHRARLFLRKELSDYATGRHRAPAAGEPR